MIHLISVVSFKSPREKEVPYKVGAEEIAKRTKVLQKRLDLVIITEYYLVHVVSYEVP